MVDVIPALSDGWIYEIFVRFRCVERLLHRHILNIKCIIIIITTTTAIIIIIKIINNIITSQIHEQNVQRVHQRSFSFSYYIHLCILPITFLVLLTYLAVKTLHVYIVQLVISLLENPEHIVWLCVWFASHCFAFLTPFAQNAWVNGNRKIHAREWVNVLRAVWFSTESVM